jgi:hypothetical protein
MKRSGARSGWQTLASTSCLLLLGGLSCKYDVTLPWAAVDASPRTPDSSFDQSPPSPPDVPTPGPETRPACPGDSWELTAQRTPVQIVVAIDRSAYMQQKNFDSSSKVLAASSALNSLAERHPSSSFMTIWFPGTNCGTSACCASPSYGSGGGRGPDPWGCGGFDAGCPPAPNDSPSHNALKLADDNFHKGTWWPESSVVILITDQNPSCAGESTSDNACNIAVTTADELVRQGVQTFVVVPLSEGRSSTPDCLNKIAKQNAPKFPDTQQPIPARTSQDLSSHLEEMITATEERICRFFLPKDKFVEANQIE